MNRFHLILLLVLPILVSSCGESPQTEREDGFMGIALCDVHGDELLEETVVPAALTVEFEIEYQNAMEALFPNLGLAFAIDYPDQDSVLVEFCPACREANRLWLEEN